MASKKAPKKKARKKTGTAGRQSNGQFERGKSGNPGGRPKVSRELRDALRLLVPDAVKALKSLLKSKDEGMRFKAVTEVLDRGIGKAVDAAAHKHLDPPEEPPASERPAVDVGSLPDVEDLNPEQLRSIAQGGAAALQLIQPKEKP